MGMWLSVIAAGLLAVALAKWLSPATAAPVAVAPRAKVSIDEALEPYAAALAKTARPALSIALEAMAADDPMASKVGGRAYWPEGADYPRDSKGEPLFLLAQIDFSAAPKLPGYPDSGLLQFFIAGNDVYGADFDAGPVPVQKDYRVVYWPAPLAPASKRTFTGPAGDSHSLPMDPSRPRRMRFTAGEETIGAGDAGMSAVLGQDAYALAESYARRKGLDENAVIDAVYDRLTRTGHKLGGYPYFTQEDPRDAADPRRLLLQLDTDEAMMWGDAGVANFFIEPGDLARRDFSRVLYNWDCH